MIIGFKTEFPNQLPTNFPVKIMASLPRQCWARQGDNTGPILYEKEVIAYLTNGFAPKKHTVRKASFDRNALPRWNKTRKIEFATGVRTSDYQVFAYAQCTGRQVVRMCLPKGKKMIQVYVDGRKVNTLTFAKNDGFDDYLQFHEWFMPIIIQENDGEYVADLIHWTNFSY
nr:hypothetical protein [uncultured Arsenicibacter sp.]